MLNNKFRGIVGIDLKAKDVKRMAGFIINYIYKNDFAKNIILGYDNRESSEYIVSLLQSELLCKGIAIYNIGVVTTPALVYLTQKFKFSVGIMITASHNAKEYNGVKCFDKYGLEINPDFNCRVRVKTNYQKIVDARNLKDVYMRHIKNILRDIKADCIFDCANGASTEIICKIFSKCRIIGNDMTGKYINDNYGSEHLSNIISQCIKYNKIGFAFDGDADRVIAIDSDGEIINGDQILYILASQRLGRGDLVVGTEVTSLVLEKSLGKLGICLLREKVGSKYVARAMNINNLTLGGEWCGHIFMAPYNISDGLLVAVELLNILHRTGKSFKELLQGYCKSYIITKNIERCDNMLEFKQQTSTSLVVVRASDTEPIMRVYIENENKQCAEEQLYTLSDSWRQR